MDGTQQFKVGDIVELKSGGPKMTVKSEYTAYGGVVCQWFSGKKLEIGTFEPETLVRTEAAEKKP